MTNERSYYLKSLHIDAFGPFMQKDIGPFSPSLNVVLGANEAGKTTVSAFVRGVLFGWEDARGQRNTYKPVSAERSGACVFAQANGDEIRCSRGRNADGVQPEEAARLLLDDIDADTFKTIFSLDSDELRGLGKTNDVTARLLTAGAGTVDSPAHVLSDIDQRLAMRLSRASSQVDSIPNLQTAIDEVRGELDRASAEAERFKHENREYLDLAPRRRELSESLDSINTEIENLSVKHDSLVKLDQQRQRLAAQSDDLSVEEDDLKALEESARQARQAKYLAIDAVEERALRDGLEDLSEEGAALDHRYLIAKQDYASSKAQYEALVEADDIQELKRKAKRQRVTQIVLSVILPVLFITLGVPVFEHAREIGSLSITALGLVLVAVGILMGCAALVMLFRPNKVEEEMTTRLQNSQWVMLQDKKKLESCEQEKTVYEAKVAAYLKEAGLDGAQGSIRRARALLDETGEARSEAGLLIQRRQSLVARRSSLENTRDQVERDRANIMVSLGLDDQVRTDVLEGRLRQKKEQRDAQLRTSESINARYGELKQELAAARHMRRFDELKLESQMLQTRMGEALEDYARLLLAKRMLQSSIAAWESKSQPAVYQQAGNLLSLMTQGKWERVQISPEGGLQAVDAFGTPRDPLLLSMGTCQQLYLSLRIALLETAGNVGRCMPILADDILVNFDAERRIGAARALHRLSESRQVIVFTCHEEVVRLMQDTALGLNLVEL